MKKTNAGNIKQRFSVLTATLLLSGCVVYPIYKTLQPETLIRLQDEDGQPVPHAKVTLISSSYPYGQERSRAVLTTGVDGTAPFPAVKEWRTEMIFIHGAEFYFWNLCVVHPDFATYETNYRSASEFSFRNPLKLVKGESKPCLQKR